MSRYHLSTAPADAWHFLFPTYVLSFSYKHTICCLCHPVTMQFVIVVACLYSFAAQSVVLVPTKQSTDNLQHPSPAVTGIVNLTNPELFVENALPNLASRGSFPNCYGGSKCKKGDFLCHCGILCRLCLWEHPKEFHLVSKCESAFHHSACTHIRLGLHPVYLPCVMQNVRRTKPKRSKTVNNRRKCSQ